MLELFKPLLCIHVTFMTPLSFQITKNIFVALKRNPGNYVTEYPDKSNFKKEKVRNSVEG